LGVFDILVKGSSPIWVGQYLLGLEFSLWLAVAPLLAVIGHNWSPYLKFQGGRGISVASGSLLAFSPLLLAVFIAVSVAGWAVTRASGVWVLVSLALLPLWVVLLPEWGLTGSDQYVISWYCIGLLVLVVIKRLLSNWTPLYEGLPKKKVIFNRLFLDRDIGSRSDWVRRTPQETE
jgi:glycerol-3-phosphate acyltransferase PlsY